MVMCIKWKSNLSGDVPQVGIALKWWWATSGNQA